MQFNIISTLLYSTSIIRERNIASDGTPALVDRRRNPFDAAVELHSGFSQELHLVVPIRTAAQCRAHDAKVMRINMKQWNALHTILPSVQIARLLLFRFWTCAENNVIDILKLECVLSCSVLSERRRLPYFQRYFCFPHRTRTHTKLSRVFHATARSDGAPFPHTLRRPAVGKGLPSKTVLSARRTLIIEHDVRKPDLLGRNVDRRRVAVLTRLPLEHIVEPDLYGIHDTTSVTL